jgi:hypothetical protein
MTNFDLALLHDAFIRSFGIPAHLLRGGELSRPLLPRQPAGEFLGAFKEMITTFADDQWYAAHRTKHTSVGQEKRDFWRTLAKIEGVRQVNELPRVVIAEDVP